MEILAVSAPVDTQLIHSSFRGSATRKTTISVVCALDDRYIKPMAAMVCSLLSNLSIDCKLQLFIIDGGITAENRSKFAGRIDPAICQLNWLEISSASVQMMKRFKISSHLSIATYYRLLLADLLPGDLDKVIYLDCDLLIQGNLKELWQIDIGDHAVLAAQDLGVVKISDQYGLINYRELGISDNAKYFNAGVLVVNLEKWRTESIGLQILEYLQTHRQYIRFHDQDGLNAILAGKWQAIDCTWNQMPALRRNYKSWEDSPLSREEYYQAMHRPQIIHFASSEKPWNSLMHPHSRLYYYYLDQTAWHGWRFPWWKAMYYKAKRIFIK
jgi:lipopolysaccharide biosynthesis glycosyltransferase